MNKVLKFPNLWTIAAFCLFVIAISLVFGQRVFAVTNYLPDWGEMSSGANVHLEIAQTGTLGEINLDAPYTWVKIYFDAGASSQLNVLLADGKFECTAPRGNSDSNYGGYYWLDTQGVNEDCDDPGAVDYNVYCSDAGGDNPGANIKTINSNHPLINLSSGPGYHNIFDTPSVTSTCPIVSGRYVVFVRAGWVGASPAEGRINGFKAGSSISGALASYWAGSGNDYAVQNRVDQMPGQDETMNFVFAPSCDRPDSELASLIWKDADASSLGGSPADGSGGWDAQPSFDLFEGDANGAGGTNWQLVATVNSGGTSVGAGYSLGITPDNIGGNDASKQLQFTAKRSKVYSWKWYNVNWDNGVQMRVPYDSFYAAKSSCPPPVLPPPSSAIPKGVIDESNCSVISGWAYDPDSPSTAIGIHIYVDGPAPGGDYYDYGATNVDRPDVNSAFGITGTHGFSWTVPAKYKDGLTHRYYVYARGVDGAGNGGGSDGDANNPQITAFSSSPNNGGVFSCPGTPPTPPPPTASMVCVGATPNIRVNWNNGGAQGSSGYYVDATNTGAPDFGSPEQGWNRFFGAGSPTTQTIASFPGNFGGTAGTLTVTAGTTYTVRIWYPASGKHSATPNAMVTIPASACLPPPVVSCTGVSPVKTEPGAPPFDLTVTFRNAAGTADLNGTSLEIKINGVGSGVMGWGVQPMPGGSSRSVTWIGYTPPTTAGKYDVILEFSGGNSGSLATNPITCPIAFQLEVASRPYFRAYGGDVISGIRPGTCDGWLPTDGSIDAYNDGAGVGAGVQLAAFALSQIRGYTSGVGTTYTSLANNPVGNATGPGGSLPKYLTFANSGSGIPNSTFGGGGGVASCPYNYFKDAAVLTPTGAPGLGLSGLNPNSLPSGNYLYDPGLLGLATGGLKIRGGNINANKKITIYVNGDVTICGDITYNTGGWGVGAIPSFYVIAKGNIYVQAPGRPCGLLGLGGSNGVNELDGVYIAQPVSAVSGGRFYSCVDVMIPLFPMTPTDVATKCNSKLTINGTVIAQKLRLFRIIGSRYMSAANELSNSGSIAEMFNAGPETWLTIPAPFTTSPIEGYDAITGLPPVL